MERLANIVMDLVGKSYLNFDDNVKLLEADLKRLASRATDIENEQTIAEGLCKKKRKREVENWFENVKQVEKDFKDFQDGEQGFLRHPLRGKRVEELQQRVAALIEQSKHFNELVLDSTENRGIPRITSNELFGEMFHKNFKNILECLRTNNVSLVGVYGMGGVGKTTLVKHIQNHLLESTDWPVRWFTISKEYSLKRLQNQVAKAISLNLSIEDDEEERAFMLSSGLMKFKDLVIILDDVWARICLKSVRIPLGENGCKVILTTRSSKLCDQMDCQKKFEANTLQRDDAWELFKYTLGSRKGLQADTEKIAMTMTEGCGGLPLAIVTMAGSMKGVEDIREWRDVLVQLESCWMANSEMEEKVFPILRLSFDRLKSEYLQRCLLYCSVYPEDYSILRDDLIGAFISARLLEGRETRKQEFDQGHRILNELVKVCLLEATKNGICVKMHDLIREMAIRITSGKSMPLISRDKPRFMVKAGMSLTEMPEQNQWAADLDTVSLMMNFELEICPQIPPNCPNLRVLILRNTRLRSIPSSFFRHMITSLQVLDLSHARITELPSCVSNMENLISLLLYGCESLTYVPPLGKLKKLRELDIRETAIKDTPQDLEMLESLRCLYLTFPCEVPKGTLCKLYHLQCLHIRCIYISEVDMLKYLEEIELKLNGMDAYNQLIKTLRRIDWYNIIVDENSYRKEFSPFKPWRSPMIRIKKLVLRNCSIGNKGEANVDLLPEDIKSLEIESCFAAGKCLSDIFPQLRILNDLLCCFVQNSFEEVEFLLRLSSISSSHEQRQSVGCTPLHSLVELHLSGLSNFVGFVKWEPEGASGCLPRGTFSNLTSLRVYCCPKIRKLLVPSLWQNLQNLQVVGVSCCDNLEEVIGEDEMGGLELTSSRTSAAILPKLRSISLSHLPELKSICSGKMASVGFVQWQPEGASGCLPRGTFSNLKELSISHCHKIRTLLVSSLLLNLQNLEWVFVLKCDKLVEIIGEDEMGGLELTSSGTSTAILPKFREIELCCLPELKSIYSGKMTSDSISKILVAECPKLKRLPLSLPIVDGQISCPRNLTEIEGSEEWWQSLEWDNPSAKTAFQPKVQFIPKSS